MRTPRCQAAQEENCLAKKLGWETSSDIRGLIPKRPVRSLGWRNHEGLADKCLTGIELLGQGLRPPSASGFLWSFLKGVQEGRCKWCPSSLPLPPFYSKAHSLLLQGPLPITQAFLPQGPPSQSWVPSYPPKVGSLTDCSQRFGLGLSQDTIVMLTSFLIHKVKYINRYAQNINSLCLLFPHLYKYMSTIKKLNILYMQSRFPNCFYKTI